MAQMDDNIGARDGRTCASAGSSRNTIVVFTTDNGAENFTWPDGGKTPFAGGKGTACEGGFRVPAIIRWPGRVRAGTVQNGIMSGLDWFPTLAAAAGNPNIRDQLRAGVALGGRDLPQLPRRLRPDPNADRAGPVGAATRSSTSPRARSPRCGSDDYKYRFTDQPQWLAGRHGAHGLAA